MYNDFIFRRNIIVEASEKFKEKKRICKSTNSEMNNNCDDWAQLDLEIIGQKIKKIQFCASGCALLLASCYLFEKILINKTISEAQILLENYEEMIKSQKIIPILEDLNALFMVKSHPNRVICISLPLFLLQKQIKNHENS